MQTLGVTDTDKQVLKGLTRALEDEFKLQKFPSDLEPNDENLQLVDLIIYDLKTGKSGFIQLKKFRQVEPTKPILLLVQMKSSPVLEEAMRLGAMDFIAKPFNKEELLLRIKRCLREFQFRMSSSSQTPFVDPSGRVVGHIKSGAGKSGAAIEVPLSNLHSTTGQLDAVAIADYLSIPLAKLAAALGVNYTTLHKTPDSAAVQPSLAMAKRILVILSNMLGKRETVLAWLNSPHLDLGNRAPIQVILEGHISAVLAVLENALAGVPG